MYIYVWCKEQECHEMRLWRGNIKVWWLFFMKYDLKQKQTQGKTAGMEKERRGKYRLSRSADKD